MSTKKNRRKWKPKEKLRIVLETLQYEGKQSEICRRGAPLIALSLPAV
jgi:transposase-like protein